MKRAHTEYQGGYLTLDAMMKRTSVTLLFLLGTHSLYSQKYDSLKSSWNKILIHDSHWGWNNFNHHFEIKKKDNEWALTTGNDSTIGKIDKSILDKFFESLTNEKGFSRDPLKIFGKDSIWLINNAHKLWFSYLGDKDEPPEVDSFAVTTIKDYGKIKKLVWGIQGSHWTDDYPSTSVSIVKDKDTLLVQSFGQYPFMMPWGVDGKSIYNSGISTSISKILPSTIESNKSRLNGFRFEYYLVDLIYGSLIQAYRDYIVAKIRYPAQFLTLEKHYRIDNARLTDMESIEWGGISGTLCLALTVRTKSLPENISFSVIFGRRIKLHSVKPLIRKEGKLISRLSNNRVYRYTLENPNTLGEIHFVNTKSFSGEAKRNFMSDVKENGMKKSAFRGRFRHAIFYELTEVQGKARSFSRWILLSNGTNILWEINGDFLMNFDSEIIKEKGYVCRIIRDKDWNK